MSFISVFDVLGPNMIGPSSSHTAGAARIGFLAQKMIGGSVVKVDFTLYGSFARTYHGHGTDRALLGGIMGFDTDDMRIRDSFDLASEQGIAYSFTPNELETDVHPNTVDISMVNASGQTMTVRGESLGGGKVRIVRINQVKVDFTGEYSAVIVIHLDRPGVVAHITKCLSDRGVNIAFMRLFREGKGDIAYTIVESDGRLPEAVAGELRENENGYFSDEECGLFRLFEERVIRLREESQLLREYCTQIQSLFQSEIDIRQNRIMQILTIVTTIFLPLTLLVGWYGMNFSGMPELHWKYGYPAIILVSVAVVVLSLWVCKKKKFW